MKERLFIRHGESQYNAYLTDNLDSQLTLKGIEQAKAAGKFLREHFGHIKEFVGITSPYHRCLQTAHYIQEETGLDFRVLPGPREIMLKYAECHVPDRSIDFPRYTWEDKPCYMFCQENEKEYISRMLEFVRSVTDQRVLVVSHGTPINTMFEATLGLDHSVDMNNFVSNCSISYIRSGEGIWFGKKPYDPSLD